MSVKCDVRVDDEPKD